jgi:hypothetical protein
MPRRAGAPPTGAEGSRRANENGHPSRHVRPTLRRWSPPRPNAASLGYRRFLDAIEVYARLVVEVSELPEADEPGWLEYFSAGVPTGEFFRITLDELRRISGLGDGESSGISRLHELCFIGLISYFEAFCKDHFASLINLEPHLVSNLKTAGQNVDVDATRVLLYAGEVNRRIGFVLAEKYDFGSAQKINALFGALLQITPFSKSEAAHFSELLSDRNLLVHHGGTFTLSYLERTTSISCDLRTRAFWESRVKRQEDVASAVGFIETIARKLLRSSHAALLKYLLDRDLEYSGEHRRALDALLWWGDDGP